LGRGALLNTSFIQVSVNGGYEDILREKYLKGFISALPYHIQSGEWRERGLAMSFFLRSFISKVEEEHFQDMDLVFFFYCSQFMGSR